MIEELLIGMFAVPLVSLLVMWLIASLLTVPKALDAQFYKDNSGALNGPAVATISFELPTERAQTYLWLLSGPCRQQLLLAQVLLVLLPQVVGFSCPARQLLQPDGPVAQRHAGRRHVQRVQRVDQHLTQTGL